MNNEKIGTYRKTDLKRSLELFKKSGYNTIGINENDYSTFSELQKAVEENSIPKIKPNIVYTLLGIIIFLLILIIIIMPSKKD